ncbi:MAG TPA: methyltransferase domain-containing protein [Steroidobacteraceae bacterium]|nr:methyltransferase domain-containing protein [Steroidobacteraceae bacterium]
MSASIRVLVVSAALTFGSLHAAQAAESPAIHPAIQAAVDSQERLPKDRARDANRHYAEIMEFFGVRPGMTVIELFAAGGNTAEVLARSVGPEGKVYMQNPQFFYDRAGTKPIEERLADNRLPNVVRLDKPLNDLGLEPNSLDGAVAFMVLHDFFWLSQDVPDVLADLYKALKPGGWFGVVDHSAPAGSGARDAMDRDKGPHRIDEAYVKKLFAEAGFVLEASDDVLRNPADDRTKPFYDESFRGKSTDRFVLRFRKKAE